jgi:hypothetical protein
MTGLAIGRLGRRVVAMAVAVVGTLAISMPAGALEAGPLQWHGPPGAAAYAVMELRDTLPIDASALRARVAAPEAYAVAGLDYHPAIAGVRLSTLALPGGRVQLRMDNLPADRSWLDLLLSLSNRRAMTLVGYRVDVRQAAASFVPMGDRPGATAPLPATPPKPALATADEDPQALARAALDTWAKAWSRRDVEAYFAAYAPGFAGRKGHASREAWMAERRERILSRQSISVTVSAIEARHLDGQIDVRFEQRYRSDGPVDLSRKRVRLAPFDGRWLIVQEVDLP